MPPEDLTVTQWAEKYIKMPARVTRHPGPIRINSLIPYAVEPLNSFRDNKRTVLIWGAQTSKTTVMECAIGYVIDQDPGPMIIVFPDQTTGKKRSKEHIQEIINASPDLKKHKTGNKDDFQNFLYHLDRMTVNVVWAGSPSALASEPARYLIRDEFAKYPDATSKEADSMSLSERRTISYSWMARILDCTTPTITNATGWQDLSNGTYKRFWVPCPHCNYMQVLIFENFKFPGREPDEDYTEYKNRVKENIVYRCESCEKGFSDMEKRKIIHKGEWRAENPEADYESYHLPSWYAPWVNFYDVARRFLDATYGFENMTLQDWVNSDCAEAWEEKGENADMNTVLAHKLADVPPGTIPTREPVLCLLVIDVQKDYLWYKVRAYTIDKSYLVEYGTMSVLEDEKLLHNKVYQADGYEFSPEYTLIDTGYRTTEVYEYVLNNKNHCIAIKGQDGAQSTPLKWQSIKKYPGQDKDLPSVLQLCHIKTTFFKEKLLLHISSGVEDDGTFNPDLSDWYLHNETGEGYARHLTAETVIEEKDQRGYTRRIWKKIRKRNDFLDCEVYAMAGRYMYDEVLREKSFIPVNEPQHGTAQKPPENWQ